MHYLSLLTMRKQNMLPAAMDLAKLQVACGFGDKISNFRLLSDQKGQEIICYGCILTAEMPLGGKKPQPTNISKFKRVLWLIAKVQSGFRLTHSAFRKHVKFQSSIPSLQILFTYYGSAFGTGLNFVQNLADAFCIELNSCGSMAVMHRAMCL